MDDRAFQRVSYSRDRRNPHQTEAVESIERGRSDDQVDDRDAGARSFGQVRGQVKRDFIIDYINRYVEANGFPPSVREVGTHIGLSVATVHWHLTVLKDEGRISVMAGRPRTLRIKMKKDEK